MRCTLSFFIAIWSATAGAFPAPQRVAFLDYTASASKGRKRPPKPPPPLPPGCLLGKTGCPIPDGICGGILHNGPISVSLEALDKTAYVIGDPMVYTLKIENTGGTPVRVPIRPRIADIEPDDARVSYRYEPMEIWITLADRAAHRFVANLIVLYGSRDKPSTQLKLGPGEWIEIRGKAPLLPVLDQQKYYAQIQPSNLSAPHEKLSGLEVFVSYWKGDILDFDARTRREQYSCMEYETASTPFHGKFTLLPSSTQ
ncbi:MAG TPA: hypothetical protein VLW54_11475 [Candidatus Acidoferrales bacterium]|nr:hypothetical protein [Candidatus Acidoferrales bacterium]